MKRFYSICVGLALSFAILLSACGKKTDDTTNTDNNNNNNNDTPPTTYTVVWKNYDNTVLETDNSVTANSTPNYDGETPTRPTDNENTYTFSGWTPTPVPVTGNATYTATFTENPIDNNGEETPTTYNVIWKNYDNTVLETDNNVTANSTPNYDGETPTRPADNENEYTFSGWSPTPVPVTGNATYTATFTESPFVTDDWQEGMHYKMNDGTYGAIPTDRNKLGQISQGWVWGIPSADKGKVVEMRIPDFIISIEENAFWTCSNLQIVTIPDSVTSIGSSAFASSKIETIIVPDSVTSIGSYAFEYCTELEEIVLSQNLTTMGNWTFHGCTSLVSIDIPSKVTAIGGQAFYGCSNLENVTLSLSLSGSSSLRVIGNSAFALCTKLETITLPTGLDEIGESAFSGCTLLNNIVLPSTLRIIHKWAFNDCTSLTSILIPSSVSIVETQLFLRCSALTNIYVVATERPYNWSMTWYNDRPSTVIHWGWSATGQ